DRAPAPCPSCRSRPRRGGPRARIASHIVTQSQYCYTISPRPGQWHRVLAQAGRLAHVADDVLRRMPRPPASVGRPERRAAATSVDPERRTPVRAVLVNAFGENPRLAQGPGPQCPPRGAVIRVRATGVCRSDWHAWMGHDDTVVLPHVPGHEFAGEIAELGAEVDADAGWRVGDRVTAPFICACGRCAECRSGNEQVCDAQSQPGFTHWGSFAEYVVVDEAALNLIRLPDSLGFVEAASLGCRFATAYRAIV